MDTLFKSLDRLPFNKMSTIVGFESETSQDDALLFYAEGIQKGSVIYKVLQTPLGDYIECMVDNTLLAIPAEICHKIIVKEVDV